MGQKQSILIKLLIGLFSEENQKYDDNPYNLLMKDIQVLPVIVVFVVSLTDNLNKLCKNFDLSVVGCNDKIRMREPRGENY